MITNGSRRSFRERFGLQSSYWSKESACYVEETGNEIPEIVAAGILQSKS